MRVSIDIDDGHGRESTRELAGDGISVTGGRQTAGGATIVDAGPAGQVSPPGPGTERSTAAGGAREAGVAPVLADPLSTPVSNRTDETVGGADDEQVAPPSDGEGDGAPPDGDVEAVEGYAAPPTEAAAEMLAAVDAGLRDIGEASFGAPPRDQLEAIIDVDDRVQVTATSTYPWRVHCALRITAADGSQWIGTGWFCGPRTVITAGHCVFIKNSGVPGRDGWVQSVTVIPGRNADQQPFGAVVSTDLHSVRGWVELGSQEYDYGAILLSTPLGDRTGWLGFGAYGDATLLASTANLSGYPGDKPAGTQWYHARRVTSVSTRKVYYDIDSFGGQSGSAVYRIDGAGRYAVAVHAYGGASANSGTRITSDVFLNLQAWKG
jgi:V8-like Glu-specific endopeptidase